LNVAVAASRSALGDRQDPGHRSRPTARASGCCGWRRSPASSAGLRTWGVLCPARHGLRGRRAVPVP